jgi:endonuclease YncB( thermonuclease family)
MPSPANPSTVASVRLKQFVRWSWAGRLLVIVMAASALADHLVWRGDDWANFAHQPVVCISAIDGETIAVRSSDSNSITPVRLLGVWSINPHWDALARDQLDSELAGRTVTLQLEGTQTRDAQGRLLAYLFLDDQRTMNAELVREGFALADWRARGTLQRSIDAAEAEAHKKRRGFWGSSQESKKSFSHR